MTHNLDLKTWSRKDHYNFYKNFEEPFFGITVRIDCTQAYKLSREKYHSFFLYYLHKSLIAVNKLEPFRYRISGDEVLVYDQVNASPTINRADGTFGFSYINYSSDFEIFAKGAREEIERVRSVPGLDPATSGENVIHYSAMPWLDFTSVSHARSFTFPDSCPKIAFGKMTESSGKKSFPVSIHAHHALMDGFHVGQFVDLFQELMNSKDS